MRRQKVGSLHEARAVNLATMGFEESVATAIAVRDSSLSSFAGDLAKLPAKLPLNVQSIPSTILSPQEQAVTELDAVEIANKTRSRQLTCEAVVRAFLKRAALAQGLVSVPYLGCLDSSMTHPQAKS